MNIENDFYRIEVDPATGVVRGVLDKSSSVQLIAEPRLAEIFLAQSLLEGR
ncbi:MAG TPA: hypothetical protein VMY39_02975 [Planctomycetota bacterium]|nr:hypothetical protein [Planctomycetota bacterium]HUV38544.1 hypothetical protein [Planctomycetota bacterium]